MKIGFDAKRAVQNRTGLGNYSRFIIDILSQPDEENDELLLYAPRPKANKELETLLVRPQVSIKYPTRTCSKWLPTLWRTWGMSREFKTDGISIFHGLSNELPLSIRKSGVKSIVTIHDLIFLRYPTFYPFIDRHIYAYKFRKACENSDHIIAISEATKRDIIHYFQIAEEKISVVYQGCAPVFKQIVPDEIKKRIREKYDLPTRYILNVGSIEKRKNLLLVVKALHRLPKEFQLIAIGKRTPYVDEIETYIRQNHLEQRVRLFHQIPFNELPTFYQMASLFVYPSRFEGFGIPIIEAIHSGVPVIAATGSCLEEAGGPSSVYIHPDDDEELARQINRIWSTPELVQRMVEESLRHVQRFSDNNIALAIHKVYQRVIQADQLSE